MIYLLIPFMFLEKGELSIADQWLILRGQDMNKPVLLLLSSGPGAIKAGRVLRFNRELEKHFVVANWSSIIGVHTAQTRPDLFHAYSGMVQMVDVSETNQFIYEMVLENSQKTGDPQFVATFQNKARRPMLGEIPSNPMQPCSTVNKAFIKFPTSRIRKIELRGMPSC